MRAGMLLVDTLSLADMRRRLDAAAEPSRSFRHTARELLALSAWRNHDLAAARRYLDMIASDAEVARRHARPLGSSVGTDRRRRQELRGKACGQSIASCCSRLLATSASGLTACSNFDPDKLDIFGLNEKKKLPGERKDVFPGGVPGVTQGIPPEYMRGNQAPPETAQAPAPAQAKEAAAGEEEKAAAAEPEEKPKPKPKACGKAEAADRNRHRPPRSRQPGRQAQPHTAKQPVALAGTGADQYCVALAFLSTTRHLPALIALGLDPKANRAANTY